MKIAVISDIHGNSDALAAVLSDIANENIEVIYNLGDHFSGPLDPIGTWEQLKSLNAVHLRGNHDRYLIEQSLDEMQPSDQFAAKRLPQQAFDWLSNLSETQKQDEILFCHGTPNNDETYLSHQVTKDGNLVPANHFLLNSHLEMINETLVFCGHSHISQIINQAQKTIVNPGSVGLPAYKDHHPPSCFRKPKSACSVCNCTTR